MHNNLPFKMWTLTDVGFALDGSHVYKPESLWIAFCTNNRLVVRTPFSVTSEMPPRGESKLIGWKKKKRNKWKKKRVKRHQKPIGKAKTTIVRPQLIRKLALPLYCAPNWVLAMAPVQTVQCRSNLLSILCSRTDLVLQVFLSRALWKKHKRREK